MSRGTSRNAHAVTGGYNVNIFFRAFLKIMMLIEAGSYDTQTAISPGFCFALAADYRFTRQTGRTWSLGNNTGSIYYNKAEGDGNIGFERIKVGDTLYYRCEDFDRPGIYGWRVLGGA